MNDLISRQALCEYALNQKDKSVTPNDIMRFPSAQPERKKGRWLDDQGKEKYDGYCAECSACGGWSEYITDFCPNCGADMRGESE